jgi:hypothetical protein
VGVSIMDKKISSLITSRRQFLTNIIPVGGLFCFGCSNLLALSKFQEKAETEKHKFQQNSNMTFEQVFKFAYSGYISLMQIMLNDTGKDKFTEMLKKAASESAALSAEQLIKSLPKNDLAAFISSSDPLYNNALTYEVVEQTDKAFEIKVTECLWAKTFREAGEPNAVDIGYCSICYTDYAFAQAFNPKLKMLRDKTLMQGHDCCNHRWIFEA